MIENRTTIRVRYAETDQMGFAYHANYLAWFEVGRTEMMREIGLPYARLEAAGFALPVTEAHLEYVRSAMYDDHVQILSELRTRPRARIHIHYTLSSPEGDLFARGFTVHGFIDTAGRPVRPPGMFRDAVAPFFTS